MAEIFGIGLTHYPPLCGHDEWFGQVVSWALADPGIPDAQKDPANWPARKREEWADDKGEKAAARKKMRKSRASYEKPEGSGLVDWTISVTANGGRK